MLYSVDVIAEKTMKVTYRINENGQDRELYATEKGFVEKSRVNAEKQISKSQVKDAVSGEINRLRNQIVKDGSISNKFRDQKLLEMKTTEFKTKLTAVVRNRLISVKQSDIGKERFKKHIDNIMKFLEESMKESEPNLT